MNTNYCQSCGMPMEEFSELYGTNSDGSKNMDYCSYCFKDGHFTADMTMNEMIDFCVPHVAKANLNMSTNAVKDMMNEFFPSLKRWKTQK